MAVILFVLLALYLLIRVGSDKIAHKDAEREFQRGVHEDEIAKERWESHVTNKEIEEELEEKIYDRDNSVIEELRNTWSMYYDGECPQYIVHNGESSKQYLYNGTGNGITDYNCLRILMCNRGLMTWCDAMLGIPIVRTGETAKRAELNYNTMIRFIKTINKRLNERGIHEDVYLELTDGSIYSIDEKSCGIGTIKWRPIISVFRMNLSNTNRGTNFK